MELNTYSIVHITAAIISISSGLYVYSRNPKSKLNISYLLFTASIFIWQLSYGIGYNFQSKDQIADTLFRTGYSSVNFLSLLSLYFAVNLLNLKKLRLLIYLHLAICLITFILILKTNLIIDGLHQYYWGPYPKAGPYNPIFLAYYVSTVIHTNIILINTFQDRAVPYDIRNKAKYTFLSFWFFSLACIDFFPNYGAEIYPLGVIPVVVFIFSFAYSIIKLKLMDTNIILQRGLTYTLLASAISLIFITTVVTAEYLFKQILGHNDLIGTLIASFIIAIFFLPIRNISQKFTEKLIFHGSTEEFAQEVEILRKEVADKEKFKAVATLASGIAHEVKNPLTSLKAFFEYYPEKKDDPEFIKKFTKIAGQEIDRIDGLVKNLLDFAKPSPLSLEPCDINNLIGETLDLLSNDLKKYKITVVRQPTIDHRPLKVDKNQIKQALLNIFMNAIDAMPEGGTLTIRVTNNESRATISISDTGQGIPKSDLKHIFEPFYSNKDGGSGLGLAITKNIIDNHQGRIQISSIPNRETETIINLPTY